MSTRAVFTFEDDTESFHVYKHMDGYPSGAAEALVKALALAWPLPRFEADEFGAAFIAANKTEGGNLRLLHTSGGYGAYPADIAYRYLIETRHSQSQQCYLWVTVWATSFGFVRSKVNETKLWVGPLSEMAEWAENYETPVQAINLAYTQ